MAANNEELKNTFTTINPATGEIIGYTKEHTLEEFKEAVSLAKKAQPEWEAMGYRKRKKYLLKIRDYIVNHTDELASIISSSTGKTRMDALATEVMSSAMAVNYYAKNAARLLKRKRLRPGNLLLMNKRSYIDRVPFGVIGIISAWNYPFGIPIHELSMGLIAGNAVVLKVAPQSMEVGKHIAKAVEAAGLPKHIFTVMNVPDRIATEAFMTSGINKLFFTGSQKIGKHLMKHASDQLMPISLELGGNDAMIVCDDADILRAAGGALWAGYSNAGQSCAAAERIYVHSKVYDVFVEKLKEMVNSLRQGADLTFDKDIGSLTTEAQFNKVKEHLADAEKKGAKIFFAESHKEGDEKTFFHPAAIVENVNNEMMIVQDETFGPVVTIEKFDTIDEAVSKANNSYFGLTASVWTKSTRKGNEIAKKLEAGAITINDHLMSHGLAETPWGGFKQSGAGSRTHGQAGLLAMTQPRTVIYDIMPFVRKNMWWFPYSKQTYEGLKSGLDFLYGKGLGLKIKALFKLTKTFMRTFKKDFS